jgi:ADP-ribose pyrophosphatase YjhB (NUDIX family)
MKKRKFCQYCGQILTQKEEGASIRDYCEGCNVFFYDNPLPVVSAIVVVKRQILLVKRKIEPQMGKWCLPSGFAESGESIEAATLRELKEETGIMGKIIDFVDLDSGYSAMYGDLLFATFEAEWISGTLKAGDDAEKVRFWDIDKTPPLAFDSNIRAVKTYIRGKQDYWDMMDSFAFSVGNGRSGKEEGNFLSDKLVRIIGKNADIIAKHWVEDIMVNKSTPTYASASPDEMFNRSLTVISQFQKWLSGEYNDDYIRSSYKDLGRNRKSEGFMLSEVISALSLLRKHIWEFALSQHMWNKTIDIYMSLELEKRMVLFFDRAAFYVVRGFEEND